MRHPGISSSLAGEQAGRGFLPVDPPGRKPIGMTVCSGIGAAEVSAPWIDWRYQSEIEEFPSAVLAHRFPNAVNLGDMTNFKEWPDANVDVLCGGTPCQSFSIAGLRKGLADPRGNLALTYLAIAAKYSPRWVVWENVPGVLSAVSHPSPDPCPPDIDLDGNDGPKDGEEILVTDEYTAVETHALWCFVAGAAKLGYHGGFISLDAQHVQTQGFPHAVPQRRERLFFVGYLGDWRRAAAVLFDGESLQGNPAPRRKAGQSTSVGAASGVAIRGREGGGTAELTGNVATALRARQGGGDKPHVMAPPAANPLTARMHKGINTTMDEGQTMVAHSLRGEGLDGTGRGTPLVPMAFQSRASASNSMNPGEIAPALDCGKAEGMAVAFDMRGRDGGAMPEGPHDNANIRAASCGSSRSYVAEPWAVRRLTPMEAERLQGFPDGFTAIEWRGKPADFCPDGPRYKALGNSWAVNCGQYVFDRIQMVEAMT